MRLKLKNLMVLMGIVSLSQSVTYGAQMTLNYDGKSHVYDKEPISLYVNELLVESSIMPPVQIDGYVLVPTREVFSAMGANVQWKSTEKKVYIEDQKSLIVLQLNSNEAWVNGEVKTMDMAPKVINDKVMVPIRFISETLGFKVDWLGVERSVHIRGEGNSDKNINSGNHILGDSENSQDITNNVTDNREDIMIDHKEEEVIEDTLEKQLPFVHYNPTARMMTFSEGLSMRINDITVDDIYTKNKIIFTINNANLDEIVEGSWEGTLGDLKSVTVTKTDYSAQIVVETNTLCATTLSMVDDKVAISFMKPREKYDKIIVVDSGHGGSDYGTSANGVNEKDLTLAYGKALCKLLEADERIKVYATRPEDAYATEGDGIIGKQYPTLDMRVNLANEISPDLYISIHINYYTGETANGIETYYYNSSDKRGQTFAKMVQEALVNEFNMTDRKAKHGDLKVVRETNDPAILIEAGFISNANDFEMITSSEYPNRFAQVIYNCILEYYAQGLS